ncbi:MAG: glycosyltransferase family 4 protein [Bacteroidales bacterium]|nr:glycosyltransferase family 4 protein [Bacteroidales bacterium]
MILKRNKVLFISQYAGFIGGLERYIHSVAALLKENGFKVYSLFIEAAQEKERFLSIFDDYWNIEDINQISEKDFDLTTVHKISHPKIFEKILQRFSPALFVHDHDYYCPKGFKYYPYKRINCHRHYSRLFCAVCSSLVPPRHMVKGINTALKKNFIESAKLFKQAMSCKFFVVLSDFMKCNLLKNGLTEEKIKIIHPFLRLPVLPNKKRINSDIPQIVFAGQQVVSKGTPLFLEAISKLRAKASVRILGSGSRLMDFKRIAEQMELKNHVSFDGWVQNPLEVFINSDIAVFPSLWQEPFGLSGIEAMSCGIPVVGFDVGGVSEWLKNEYNGILVSERDTTAMAAAIDKLLVDNKLRKTLGNNARQGVEKDYCKQKFLRNFINII